MNLLDDKIGQTLEFIGIDKDFLNRPQVARNKALSQQLRSYQIENILCSIEKNNEETTYRRGRVSRY